MLEQGVDLGAPLYWLVVFVAMVAIVPLVHGRVRAIGLAAIDLGFACLCVGVSAAPVLVGAIVGVFLLCRAIASRSARTIAVVVTGGAVLAGFVAHKVPALDVPSGVRGALAAVAFSYVALRMVELIRAVAERRHPAPTLDAVISYLLPFHMLAAGPIQAYDEFRAQPAVPAAPTLELALEGLDRIASGLFKKFVIAQVLQSVVLTEFRADGAYLLLEVQIYYVWIYLDFSAYSDIAVGIGKLIGRATPENFANPLAARSIIEFWERWHISLSQFIRRNLFIPIQLTLGRRTGGARPLAIATVAFSVSFLLCGLWHGVTARFLVWGGIHAAGLIVTNLYKHALAARLGRKGVKAYLARRPVRWLATALTFEFIAFSLTFIAYPFDGGWL